MGRTGHDAALRHAGVRRRPRQSEIGQPDSLDVIFEQDVGRLDVAVDQPLRVGRRQTGRGLHADSQDLGDRQRPVPVEPVLQ